MKDREQNRQNPVRRSIRVGLFNRRTSAGRRIDLVDRFRIVLAKHVLDHGGESGLHLWRHPSNPITSFLKDFNFPTDLRARRPMLRAKVEDAKAALELYSVELTDVVEQLAEFERVREGLHHGKNGIVVNGQFERAFGYSSWLAMELVENLPPGQEKGFLQSLRPGSGTARLLYWPVSERVRMSAQAVPALSTGPYLRRRPWPTALRAFLTLALDPVPQLSMEELCLSLQLGTALPAIDRWLLLLRAAQLLIAVYQQDLSDCHILRKLLRGVGSVEACRILALGLGEAFTTDFGIAPLEEELLALAGHEPNRPDNRVENLLRSNLTGLTNPSGETAAQQLAVLDRHSAILSGLRLGTVLAALTGQVRAFTDSRSEVEASYFQLASHPSLELVLPKSNLGRQLRLASIQPLSQRELYSRLLGYIAEGDHRAVLETPTTVPPHAEVLAVLVSSCLTMDDCRRAVELSASFVAQYPWLIRRLPLAELVAGVPDELAETPGIAICRAVVCDAAVKHLGIVPDKRNDSVEDALELLDVSKPTLGVSGLLTAVPTSIAAYFLRVVCTPEVLDTVPVGTTTAELLEERLQILGLVRRMTPDARNEIGVEMKDLAIMMAAHRAMASLDHQKVYVNTSGLRARLRNTLADDFARYRQFRELETADGEISAILKVMREARPDLAMFDLGEFRRALVTEADRTLLQMILAVRHEFSVSHEHGLDGYLSGGIRHGVLESHLREPLVRRDLLGVYHFDGTFSAPELHQIFIEHAPPEVGERTYLTAFRKLSDEFQSIVEEVRNEWVRIETNPVQTKAFFRLYLADTDVRYVQGLVAGAQDVDDFIERNIRYWWSRVDEGLADARDRVKTELRGRLQCALRAFYDDMLEGGGVNSEPILQNLVGPVFGDLDRAIDSLESWFMRAESPLQGDTHASVAVEVADQTVRSMHPAVSIVWRERVVSERLVLTGRELKHWVSILTELLSNAALYCGSERCIVALRLVSDEHGDVVCLENAVTVEDDAVERLDRGILAANERLGEDTILRSVAREGGSGLAKVLKYARIDLGRPQSCLGIERVGQEVRVCLRMERSR